MLLGLEGVQGDIYFGPLVDLHHEFHKEGALCQLAEVHTQVAHFNTVLKGQVGHDARDPKDTSDASTLDTDV